MRILQVTQAYYPFLAKGGPATKVRAITRALVQRGNQVTVLTADLGFGPDEIATAQVAHDSVGWRSDMDGAETIYFTTWGQYRNLTLNPGVISFCRRRIREFDIVHIYGLYDILGPAVGEYCRKYNVPYFLEPLGMTRSIDRGFTLKRIWRGLAGGYLRGAVKWVATSELERKDLEAAGIPVNRVIVRANGIETARFKQLPPFGRFRRHVRISDDEPLILFLGRIIPRKGADLLIDALTQISNKKTKLVIAGPEGEKGYLSLLQEKARIQGVTHQVLFVGPLYEDSQKEAYVDATVFALPSRYENFGNTVAESIACGTPVIVSDRCGIAPLINQRAGLVTSYDSKSVARTLTELLNNPDLYQRLKAGCPLVARQISWDGLVDEIQSSYQDEIGNYSRHQLN